MSISSAFDRKCIRLRTEADSKKEILKEIAQIVEKSGKVPNYTAKQIYQALAEREEAGSTGFEEGIALPHCSIEEVEDFVAGLVISREGIEYDSVDGSQSRIFFFIVGPSLQRKKHIKLLSSISRIAMDEQAREEILAAESEEEVYSIVKNKLDEIHDDEAEQPSKGYSLVHIFAQREEPFEELLAIFSAAVPGSVGVIEGGNAGSYLDRLPLFSTFWTNREPDYLKIIVAVVEKHLQNEIIRRVNTIVTDIEDEPGVLVTVQDLTYTVGSLEY